MSPPAKSLRQRMDAAPTTKWAAITALVTFLGTSGGFKIIDRLAPRTGETLARIEGRQIDTAGKVDAILRSQDAMARAFWRAGIRIGTNEVPQ